MRANSNYARNWAKNDRTNSLDRPRNIHCNLPRRWRPRSHCDYPRDRRLVQNRREAHLESSQLRVRSRLDHAVCHDVRRGLAGVASGGIHRRKGAAPVVYRATGPERRMVVDLLWSSPAWLGVRGDRDLVGGDCGDDASVLPAFQARRLAAGSVPGLGELRRSAQLCDLAAQLIIVTQPPHPVVSVPPQNLSGWGTRPELAAVGVREKSQKSRRANPVGLDLSTL
jgi:hypothetical protein